MEWTFTAIYKICAPSILENPTKFAKALPPNWNFDIKFCGERKEVFFKIASFLQSLSDPQNDPSSPRYQKKMKELLALLNSDPRFACIKMFPVTTDPNLKKNSSTVPSNEVSAKTTVVTEGKQLLTDKTVIHSTFFAVSRLSRDFNLASEKEFVIAKPSGWDMDLPFCRERKDDLLKIASLLQLMSNRGLDPSTSEYKQKEEELLHVLDSDPRFLCIKKQLMTMIPAPKPVSRASSRVRVSNPVPKKAKPPKSHKDRAANTTVKGIDYDPEIELEKGLKLVSNVTEFSRDADHIRIYIDETWPNSQEKTYDNVGVIAGIVWLGAKPDFAILPWIKTHIRSKTGFPSAVTDLLNCAKAFPFICPVFKDDVSNTDYQELLRIALITLLGWVLPQDGKHCDVKIFCEGITTSAMEPGKNYADSFKEIRNTVGMTTSRMGRWNITEFVCMKEDPVSKSFEYIPYADTIAYLTNPQGKARQWAEQFHVENWPGYVPISLDLLQRLVHLDSDSPAGYADELFAFARDRQKTKLFFYVLDQAVKKAESDPAFKTALFEKLEKMFEDKERDLPLLNHLCKELSKRFPLDSYEGCPRQKLIRILVELQNANHAGDPERAQECVRLYTENRKLLLNEDFYLCAYTDMNLTVHYNDRFDFASAAAICRNWENQSDFERLNRENQGRILSSIGQSYSISGDYAKAEEYFRRAIEVFRDPFNPLPDQADQTGVYLALNELDSGNFAEAGTLAEKVFGCSFSEAVQKYAGNTDKPFHHHLLVKNLYFNPEVRSVRQDYLSHKTEWTGEEQHPWELIELYRILLLHEAGDPTGLHGRFDMMSDLYQALGNGGIILLLKAFALTACRIICGTPADKLPELLAAVEEKLPATAPCCKQLSEYLERGKTDAAFWKLIPFNYK